MPATTVCGQYTALQQQGNRRRHLPNELLCELACCCLYYQPPNSANAFAASPTPMAAADELSVLGLYLAEEQREKCRKRAIAAKQLQGMSVKEMVEAVSRYFDERKVPQPTDAMWSAFLEFYGSGTEEKKRLIVTSLFDENGSEKAMQIFGAICTSSGNGKEKKAPEKITPGNDKEKKSPKQTTSGNDKEKKSPKQTTSGNDKEKKSPKQTNPVVAGKKGYTEEYILEFIREFATAAARGMSARQFDEMKGVSHNSHRKWIKERRGLYDRLREEAGKKEKEREDENAVGVGGGQEKEGDGQP